MAVLKLHWLDDFAMPLVYLLISFSQVCARCHIRLAPSFSWLAGKLFVLFACCAFSLVRALCVAYFMATSGDKLVYES